MVLTRGTFCAGVWNTEMEERENENGKSNEWKSMNGQFLLFHGRNVKKGWCGGGESIDQGQACDEPCLWPALRQIHPHLVYLCVSFI